MAGNKPGPAPGIEGKLARLGLRSRAELALHLPLRYEDETAVFAPEAAPLDRSVLVEARVLKPEVAYRPRRQLVVRAEGLALRFLNFYGSQLKAFQRAADEGLLVRAYGEVRRGLFGAEMIHPRYRLVPEGEPLASALTPVYPSTAGLAQPLLRRLVLEALAGAELAETLPQSLLRRHSLQGIAESVRLLHQPPPQADAAALAQRTHPAWRRVKFDELLAQQLSMRMAYHARRGRDAPAL
ncbi:MAG: ATP-dependent DNA helicase RecG, partial [Betaproteobacteria bacterium]|nr:ATP-dependent DNA helicase RecG [Betaproteobacteria bacterium]